MLGPTSYIPSKLYPLYHFQTNLSWWDGPFKFVFEMEMNIGSEIAVPDRAVQDNLVRASFANKITN